MKADKSPAQKLQTSHEFKSGFGMVKAAKGSKKLVAADFDVSTLLKPERTKPPQLKCCALNCKP